MSTSNSEVTTNDYSIPNENQDQNTETIQMQKINDQV